MEYYVTPPNHSKLGKVKVIDSPDAQALLLMSDHIISPPVKGQ
jgi:hypothetical protein